MSGRVVLIGLPGVGKSSVGARVAAQLDRRFVDLDDVVAAATGMPVARLLETRGEPAFRTAEAAALGEVLAGADDMVVATGGGVVETASSRALLAREQLVVWLVAPSDVVVERLADGASRPLVGAPTREGIDELGARRSPWYREVATESVEATGTVDEVAQRVRRLAERP